MITKQIEAAINAQINQELSASYVYLGMVAYFEQENLSGFAHWCLIQHQEELQHAMRLFRYLLDRGGHVQLENIEKPRQSYDGSREVFATALEQEQANTQSINQLYSLAAQLGDHATMSHLQWFLDEQVEEEKTVSEVLALVDLAGHDANALLYLNDKLGSRQPEPDSE